MNVMPANSVKHCIACGKSFCCGAATGLCWCMELPRLSAIPADQSAGCLCRECLLAHHEKITQPAGVQDKEKKIEPQICG